MGRDQGVVWIDFEEERCVKVLGIGTEEAMKM